MAIDSNLFAEYRWEVGRWDSSSITHIGITNAPIVQPLCYGQPLFIRVVLLLAIDTLPYAEQSSPEHN